MSELSLLCYYHRLKFWFLNINYLLVSCTHIEEKTKCQILHHTLIKFVVHHFWRFDLKWIISWTLLTTTKFIYFSPLLHLKSELLPCHQNHYLKTEIWIKISTVMKVKSYILKWHVKSKTSKQKNQTKYHFWLNWLNIKLETCSIKIDIWCSIIIIYNP